MNTESNLSRNDSTISKRHDAAIAAGCNISHLREALSNKWQLAPEEQQFLADYFLRRWQSRNLLALLKDGCLHYGNHRYQVAWVGGKVAATTADYCYLSFRRPFASTLMPIVLISKENY